MATKVTEASLTAQNTFSDPAELTGPFSFSLSGTWAATVYLKRSTDGGVTYLPVEGFTANTEMTGTAGEPALYIFGIETGGFTSGTVVGRIAQ